MKMFLHGFRAEKPLFLFSRVALLCLHTNTFHLHKFLLQKNFFFDFYFFSEDLRLFYYYFFFESCSHLSTFVFKQKECPQGGKKFTEKLCFLVTAYFSQAHTDQIFTLFFVELSFNRAEKHLFLILFYIKCSVNISSHLT